MSVLAKRGRNQMGRPFRSLLSDLFDSDDVFHGEKFNNLTVPPVNVRETKDDFKIEIAAPGLHKEDFKIDIENGVLNVSAEKEEEAEEKENDYIRNEFKYSSFGRSFTLPESINSEKISAKYLEGVLKITLAKKEESKKIAAKAIKVD